MNAPLGIIAVLFVGLGVIADVLAIVQFAGILDGAPLPSVAALALVALAFWGSVYLPLGLV
jgi:hypothetical protein